MGGRATVALALVAFLLGVGLIAYPYVSDYVHKLSQAQVVSSQEQTVSGESQGALEDERQRALDYNRRLLMSRSVVTDPFDPKAQRVTPAEYKGLMNLAGDGVMGTIVIPKIGLTMPVYHGTGDAELQKGVGHLENTSLPYGGPSSHAVLAGHNGLPSVKIFDDLDRLEVGDWFVLQVLGEDHAYRVTGKETVLPDQTDGLMVQEGKDLVTLVTCTPYGVNTHRLLVHAERTDVPAEWADRDSGEAPAPAPASLGETPLLPFTLVGLAIALGVLLARRLAGHAGVVGFGPARVKRNVGKTLLQGSRFSRVGENSGASGGSGVGFEPALKAYKRAKHGWGRRPRG